MSREQQSTTKQPAQQVKPTTQSGNQAQPNKPLINLPKVDPNVAIKSFDISKPKKR